MTMAQPTTGGKTINGPGSEQVRWAVAGRREMRAWEFPRPCARRFPWSPHLLAARKKSWKMVFVRRGYYKYESCGLAFVSHWRRGSVQAGPGRKWAGWHTSNNQTYLESSQIYGFLADVGGRERGNEIIDGETHVGASSPWGHVYINNLSLDSGPASIRQIPSSQTNTRLEYPPLPITWSKSMLRLPKQIQQTKPGKSTQQ